MTQIQDNYSEISDLESILSQKELMETTSSSSPFQVLVVHFKEQMNKDILQTIAQEIYHEEEYIDKEILQQ